MNRQQTLPALGRVREQFDLAALDEVNHLVVIAAGVDVGMARNFDRTRIQRLALQRLAQLLFEQVCLLSLCTHHRLLLNAHKFYISPQHADAGLAERSTSL